MINPEDEIHYVPSPCNDDATGRESKKKYPSFWANLCDYFTEYTEFTTLEVFPYLGDKLRSLIEKAFWFVIIIICLYLSAVIIIICLYLSADMIMQTYVKWDNSPVIVSFAQSPTPVGNIPFPAITLCSETKAKQTSFNFTYYYHLYRGGGNMTDKELHQFEDISLLCDPHIHNEGRPITSLNVVDFYKEVAPTFQETLWVCLWQSQNETCVTLFNPILTEEGICYTFNMLDRDEIFTNEVYHNKDFQKVNEDSKGWNLENGYEDSEDLYSFPKRAMTAGAKAGLTILIKGPVQGFKVSLHNPGEIPRVGNQFFRAPLNQEIIVAIKPDMITTSSGLKDYDPHRRGCYFAKERQLRYFKEYTQQNCDIEPTELRYRVPN
ncbi:Amiloride-sensitive sodium channel [Popillia japonica]|uniref:Amiloride-sensitive sodium channel n=1 Tax=Popillia japonica TaxID=7064 RepID=A0AAW1JXS5_POPJA